MMRTRPIGVVAALAFAALLAACTVAPIYNVNEAPVTTASGKPVTAAQVRTAIIASGAGLGWKIVDAGPGRLEGTLVLRTHTAVVDIPYSAKSYSITFKSGENLRAEDGSIHKNYNGWIQNLDRAIRATIAAL